MNPTEIKKVLGEYIDLVAKDGRLEFTIGQLELKAREYIATLDPLQHLFGSPLSQIEDMVEGIKPLAAMPSDAPDFAEWIVNNDYAPLPTGEGKPVRWYIPSSLEGKQLTTAELYTAYLKRK